MIDKPLKLGVIGGSIYSSVGRVHHTASQLDGCFKITTGCFSKSIKHNNETAKSLNLCHSKTYTDWKKFIISEKNNIDAVLLLTPTPLHAEMAIEVIKHNIPLICEKALCTSKKEAIKICDTVEKHNGFIAVTYNYSGYPMVRELKNMIEDGDLGRITHVVFEMPQEGYLRLDKNKHKFIPQDWRLKDYDIPTLSLDLGVHIHHLIYFLTNAKPLEVCSMQQSHGYNTGIIDNIQCIAKYDQNLPVQIWYGKTALGHENGLKFRIFGSEKSAEWLQINPDCITLNNKFGNKSIITSGSSNIKVANQSRYSRFKPGHPTGFIEAFANYYFDIAQGILAHEKGESEEKPLVAPLSVSIEGVNFLSAISLSANLKKWVEVQ